MATNSYGWATPNKLDPAAGQYSTDMGMQRGGGARPGYVEGGTSLSDQQRTQAAQQQQQRFLQNQQQTSQSSVTGMQNRGFQIGSIGPTGTQQGYQQGGSLQGFNQNNSAARQAQLAMLNPQQPSAEALAMNRSGPIGPKPASNIQQGWGLPQNGGLQDTYNVSGGDRTGTGNGQPSYNQPGNNVPTAPQWDYSPQSNPYLKQFNDTAQQEGSLWNTPGYYRDPKNQAAMNSWVNSYLTPLFNANLADRTQNFNEQQAYNNYLEQQRVNTGQMDIAYRGSNREDLALQYGQQNNVRDFGEQQRQFNVQQGLAQQQQDTDARYKAGLINAQEYQNETGRIQAQNEYTLGRGQLNLGNKNADISAQKNQWDYNLGQGANTNQANQIANEYNLGKINANNVAAANQAQRERYQGQTTNEAFANQTQRELGQGNLANQQFANQTGRQQVQNEFMLGQGNLANQQFANQAQAARFQGQTTNEAFANQTQRELGQGALTNEAFANQSQRERYQGQNANEAMANQTALQNVLNQYALGQGGLSFQNRELDVNSAYQQQQLAQQATLAREQMRNELLRQRMDAYGRVSGPNQRAALSWY